MWPLGFAHFETKKQTKTLGNLLEFFSKMYYLQK